MIFEKEEDQFILLGFLNSNVANMIIKMLNPTVSVQIGDVVSVPLIDLSEEEKKELDKEKSIQKAVIGLKKKYGKNAVLKGMNFKDGATTIERNGQVGGHKA